MFVKFAVIKWLPSGVIITGLTFLIYHASAGLAESILSASALSAYMNTLRTDTVISWLVIVTLTLGLRLYGEYRHSKAVTAQ